MVNLKAARGEAERLREELGDVARTSAELELLSDVVTGLGYAFKGIGGNTLVGVFAGLSSGLAAAAGEVENINAGLKAIDEGDFSGGMEGLLGAAQVVLGAIQEGVQQVFGEDLPAAAEAGFSAIDGALGGAAAGAVFGPWGAVIGGVLGGIGGLFGGITAEQEEMRAAQEEITKEAEKSRQTYVDTLDAIKENNRAANLDVLDSRIELAVSKGTINEDFADIKQAKVDIITATQEYQDEMRRIK